MSLKNDSTLQDIGERRLVSEVIADYCDASIGDDCASFPVNRGTVVVTTDPVPQPAAWTIGGDKDYYWAGWLLVTINASDLAASGATPVAILTAIDARTDMPVYHLHRFLQGIRDACKQENLRYVGGNIRESNQFTAVGTAIGHVTNNSPLTREGILDGDALAIVGGGGEFWADALMARKGNLPKANNNSPLFRPLSKSIEIRALHSKGLIRASIDNSDGLLSSISQLCAANGLGAILDLGKLPEPKKFDEKKEVLGISHQRLWLGWGDWNIVVAVPKESVNKFVETANSEDAKVCICGEFCADISALQLEFGGSLLPAPRLESERFSKDSWFTSGIDGYISLIKQIELPGNL